MKVIVDTNILISAAFRDRDPEKLIFCLLRNESFQWIASEAIVKEYTDVISRKKFKLDDATIQRWNSLIVSFVESVEVHHSYQFQRDRKDAKFIECALSGGADIFVTGDRDFELLPDIPGFTVMTVPEFMNAFCVG